MSVLIVDDEADARALLAEILTTSAASVRQATSGADCLQQLDEAVPDLLVCDIGMQGLNGYQLMQLIRQRPVEQGGQNSCDRTFRLYGQRIRKKGA
ncbi:MAG: response regulator [Leptolyngbya sp. SIO4C1]|nr:response regulator [Leptolyngbya sp. SIO4C1]